MVVSLKKIANVTTGNSSPGTDEFSKNGIPFIRAGSLEFLVRGVSIDECEKIDPAFAKEKRMRLFSKGSILFAKSGMSAKMGRIYVLPEDAYVVNDLAVITITNENSNNQFIAYYFNYRPPFNLIKDDAYPSISINDIENVEIPLPDLETQNKIVAILDKVKAILGKQEETINKYDALLRATFLKMFGDPFFNPKKFPRDILANKCSFITKGTTPKNFNILDKPFEGCIPFLKVYHIKDWGIDFYYKESYVSSFIHNKDLRRSKVKPNDILMNIVGPPLGKIGLVPDIFNEWNINQALVIFRPKKELKPIYLLNALKSKTLLLSIIEQAVGVRQQNLSLKQCREIRVPIPPVELQKEFEKIYIINRSFKEKNNRSKIQTENLLNAISQLAFKGELKFNTAVDLEVLLENDYAFFKENSNEKAIQLLLERLDKNELNENKFYEQNVYDKAKSFVFELLKEGRVKQVFDKKTQAVKLSVK